MIVLNVETYDAIPLLKHLLKEMGFLSDGVVNWHCGSQYFYFSGKKIAYCAIKGSRVRVGEPQYLHRVKRSWGWIDLADPSSLEMIKVQARKFTRG